MLLEVFVRPLFMRPPCTRVLLERVLVADGWFNDNEKSDRLNDAH